LRFSFATGIGIAVAVAIYEMTLKQCCVAGFFCPRFHSLWAEAKGTLEFESLIYQIGCRPWRFASPPFAPLVGPPAGQLSLVEDEEDSQHIG